MRNMLAKQILKWFSDLIEDCELCTYNPPTAKMPVRANLSCHDRCKPQIMGRGRPKMTKSITMLNA